MMNQMFWVFLLGGCGCCLKLLLFMWLAGLAAAEVGCLRFLLACGDDDDENVEADCLVSSFLFLLLGLDCDLDLCVLLPSSILRFLD